MLHARHGCVRKAGDGGYKMLSEVIAILVYAVGVMQGLALGYMWWAPNSAFKRGFVDGMTFGAVRRLFKK